MSLVGPRPEVRQYVDLYTSEQMNILNVRPGITDMSSIVYKNENEILENVDNPEQYYIDVIMQDKLRINQEYILKSSFWLDIKLIFRTLLAIVN
jgi:lipopolysaccharide/colanic/teichoic acid biosynthesis glycosyltransferase